MTDRNEDPLAPLLSEATTAAFDLTFGPVRRWKEAVPGRKAAGCLPVYIPQEVIRAAGMLPVGVFGGGDQLEIIRGDAYFQSYICHIPRSIVELALSGRLGCLDAMIFPSTCDVIRNLSGMWQMLLPGVVARYLDLPQDRHPDIGGRFFRHELRSIAADLSRLSGIEATDDSLREAIAAYNGNRRRLAALARLRRKSPHLAPVSETFVLMRAGMVLPVEEFDRLLDRYLELAPGRARAEIDNCRVVVRGTFCEQPPLGLLRTLERAGCDIVEDDLVLGAWWLRGDVREDGDPWEALSEAFLTQSVPTACMYPGDAPKGEDLVRTVRDTGAEGVIFAAPSFCDPALLDQPMLADALDRAGIPHTAFRYSEDTGQFQGIREQAGTFADSIKLWSER